MTTKQSRHAGEPDSPGRARPCRGRRRSMMLWEDYGSPGCWDEMLVAGRPRDACAGVMRYLGALGEELLERQQAAEVAIRTMGITFTVYSQAGDIDRAWPFDVIPRVISTQEWRPISAG